MQGLGERFDFTHDRIREVASGRVLTPRRKLIQTYYQMVRRDGLFSSYRGIWLDLIADRTRKSFRNPSFRVDLATAYLKSFCMISKTWLSNRTITSGFRLFPGRIHAN